MAASDVEPLWRYARRLAGAAGRRKGLPPLLMFTDPLRTSCPEAAIGRLPAGAGVVFRAFGSPDAAARGLRLKKLATARRVMFAVGADAALATGLGAGGLHLPERALGRKGAIAAWRRRFLVTAAAHDIPSILRAKRAGVAAIVLSPVFASVSPSAGRALGTRRAARWARLAGRPVYALGGVNPTSALRIGRWAAGIAAVGAFRT